MMDFSWMQVIFNILIIIFVAVLIIYISIAVIIIKQKHKGILLSILCGIVLVPVLTYVIFNAYLSFTILSAQHTMIKTTSDYLYTKYGFEKDDYTTVSVFSNTAYCEKDGEQFIVETIGMERPNKENLNDNYQAEVISDSLNQYVGNIFGYPTEIESDVKNKRYGLDRKFNKDIITFLNSGTELGYLLIFIHTNDNDVEKVLKEVQGKEHILYENLHNKPTIYICTETPSARSEGRVRGRVDNGMYVAYSNETWKGWHKEPRVEPY